MAKLTYKENEALKADGKLFGDTVLGLAKAISTKTLVDIFNNSWSINLPKRVALEKMIFGSFGASWLEPPVHVCVGKNVSIGNGCYINFNSIFVDDWKITVEDNVMFGPNVTIITTGHPVHPELRPHGEMYCAPVTIKKGAWLCSNVTVLPGVTIGENAVIGAGSVVTKDIPANTIAMGVPCKVVREINDNDKIYYYKDRKVEPNDIIFR